LPDQWKESIIVPVHKKGDKTDCTNVRVEVFMAVTLKNAASGMLGRVALVRTDVSEEPSTSIIRVTRISELGTMLTVTGKQCMLRRNMHCVLVASYG
jgi:hypothetical protein